jgi:fluoride ion exporter CrcB/FEX
MSSVRAQRGARAPGGNVWRSRIFVAGFAREIGTAFAFGTLIVNLAGCFAIAAAMLHRLPRTTRTTADDG